MDALEKLAALSSQMAFEADEDDAGRRPLASGCHGSRLPVKPGPQVSADDVRTAYKGHPIPITMTSAGGRRVPLLKAMLTTACERDCLYCGFRAGTDCRRLTFKPEEMAGAFQMIHQAGMVEGLFLSTGLFGGGVHTQDKLLDTAEILRNRLGYRGYLHLKIMPGAERDQIRRALELADRVSLNLEAPDQKRLSSIAPKKQLREELLLRLQWIEEIRSSEPAWRGWNGRWSSSATQFVVGAADESDVDLLALTSQLMRTAHLARTYFMAFTPVEGTPLENHPPEDPLREHRLYQASYLLRDYGFDLEDLPFDPRGHLPIERDPKSAYAEAALSEAPVELNRVDRHELLRVPGIGPRGASAILKARRTSKLRDLSDLRALGVVAERAAPYITLDGRRPARQQRLF